MNSHNLIRMAAVLMTFAVAAQADWNEGDPYKMHHPQLPNPDGWDVSWSNPLEPGLGKTLADDFKCRQSGEITDVHFWVSWRDDDAVWDSIDNIHLSIHKDIPAGNGPYEWSQPGELLWEWDVRPGEFVYREEKQYSGHQGWLDFDLERGAFIIEPQNHFQTWQINIMDIADPFYQVEGEIYWLDIRIDQEPGLPGEIGWKTSLVQWNDDAVVDVLPEPFEHDWLELRDPETGESLDMAFVVVPEPTVIVMVLLPAAGFIFLRRRFMI